MPRLPAFNALAMLLVITFLALRLWVSSFTKTSNHDVGRYGSNYTSQRSAYDAVSLAMVNGLSDFWFRAMLIKQWQLDYQANSWELIRPLNISERNLREARFHLATAEVFAATTHDNLKARAEIGRVERYLSAMARPGPIDPLLAETVSFGEALDTMSLNGSTINTDNLATFEKIKTDLDRLIASVRGQKKITMTGRVDA